ncbi:hypothetical protein RJ640_000231 [Escallonia rubra]|uniref:Thaumatin-like protein n=1 Tax=Escallonia rubra TaxID=112253 RepID=A0AA88RRJ9_9ASTE|nr:hypothetical protein RJ640_000231 [Escallonia rubra]
MEEVTYLRYLKWIVMTSKYVDNHSEAPASDGFQTCHPLKAHSCRSKKNDNPGVGQYQSTRYCNVKALWRHKLYIVEQKKHFQLKLANECTYPVWPVVVSGHGTPPLTTTPFTLEPGESASIFTPASWSGQLWARTLCSYDLTGRFNCLTGDCGTGSEECASVQTVPPETVAMFNMSGNGGLDFYGVSAMSGYNLAILVVPQGDDEGNCMATACVNAPEGPYETGVTCNVTCFAFGDPRNFCSRAYAPPGTCKPSYYSLYFGSKCPWAYRYVDDIGKEKSRAFACSRADYRITFCPHPSLATGHKVAAGAGTQPSSAGKTKRVIVIVLVVAIMFLSGYVDAFNLRFGYLQGHSMTETL